ncbi:MAG: DNA polymerase III subunit gamma/tau [Acidimicrobiales bacterium]
MAEAPDDTPYQSLYRRFRPATFGEIRGQDHVVLALRNAVREHRVAHAYLFSGPRGTGKTSTARILAKALNCADLRDGEPCGVCVSCLEIAKGTSLDVHELDAASNSGVEAMRDLVAHAALGTPGRQKVYIVDEVHMLSTAASNALLKTLEEPPAHVIFVLATTDPQKVLPTIRSRTQHFEFRLLGSDTLAELLSSVREDAVLDLSDEAIELAVRRGRGSARDALSVLDQVLASDAIDDDRPELDEVVEALAERDVGRALAAVAHLTSAGFSPQQLATDLIDELRQGFLSLVAPELVASSGVAAESVESRAARVGLAALVRAIELLGQSQVTMRDAPDPRVDLEVALVRLTHPEADDSPGALLARIERLEAGLGGRGSPPRSEPETPLTRPITGVTEISEATATEITATEITETESAEAPDLSLAPTKTLGALRRERTVGATEAAAPSVTELAAADADAPQAQAAPGPVVATAAPAPGGSEAGFPSRDQLVQAWGDQVIAGLRPKAKALFQAGRFVAVDGERAVFGLPNETHRVRCEDVRPEVESALSDHFGRRVDIDLVIDPGATPAPSRSDPSGESAPPARASRGRSRAARETSPPPVEQAEPPIDDVMDFDHSGLEVAEVDTSAEARVLQAFPGAEEVR